MRVTTKGVMRLAEDAGMPQAVIDRHTDALVSLVLKAAKRERKICRNAVRAWYFSQELTKPQLFEILDDVDEDLV